jgi:beta-hydroxyacyl-ACP dehydratase FabZ
MSQTVSQYDVQEILNVLPHRYPFLLVDRIVEYEEMRRIVGIKNVTMNEPFFQGHFPGAPIMPGVLILEAMAQVGGFLVFKTLPNRETKLVFFAGVENARFRRPVTPGDQLRIEMVINKIRGRVGKLSGKAYVDGQVAAEADITFSLVDRPVAETAPAEA